MRAVIAARLRGRRGQAALEFLLVAAVMLACVAILAVLLAGAREHGARVVDLVASEDP